MQSQRSLRKLCWSCLNRSKLQTPEPRNVPLNLNKYMTPYQVTMALTVVLAAYLTNARALLPVFSFVAIYVYFAFIKRSPLGRTGTVALLLPHVFFVGFFGGTVLILLVSVVFVVCLLHAAARKPSKIDSMKRLARSTTGSESMEALELGVRNISVDVVSPRANELDEFRRHSESLKSKYGIL